MTNLPCPRCGADLTPEEIKSLWGKFARSAESEARKAASRANGRKGGRPKRTEQPTR